MPISSDDSESYSLPSNKLSTNDNPMYKSPTSPSPDHPKNLRITSFDSCAALSISNPRPIKRVSRSYYYTANARCDDTSRTSSDCIGIVQALSSDDHSDFVFTKEVSTLILEMPEGGQMRWCLMRFYRMDVNSLGDGITDDKKIRFGGK